MAVEIRAASIGEIVDLRHAILRVGLPRESAVFAGDEAEMSRHFAAVDSLGRVVGCLTLHLNEWAGEAAYQLRGMATDFSVRGKGVGKRLIESAETFVAGSGVRVMWCNARTPAAGFYVRMGWEVVSEEFEIPAAGPHVRMVRWLGR